MTTLDNDFHSAMLAATHLCDRCGASPVRVTEQRQTFTYGEQPNAAELTVVVPVYSCQVCGAEYTDFVAEELRHDAVCRHLGVLTPAEIRAIRENQYGLSRERFAEETKLGIASIQRWESGALIQNKANDLYLRLVAYLNSLDLLQQVAEGRALKLQSNPPTPKDRRFLYVMPTPQSQARGRDFFRPNSERKVG